MNVSRVKQYFLGKKNADKDVTDNGSTTNKKKKKSQKKEEEEEGKCSKTRRMIIVNGIWFFVYNINIKLQDS